MLLGVDPTRREDLSKLSNAALFARCADLPDVGDVAAFTLRPLARRIQQLTPEVKELALGITKAIQHSHPQFLDLIGAGPDSVAALLIAADDNPERLTSEASFAALCGVSPVEQPSGTGLSVGDSTTAATGKPRPVLYRTVVTRPRRDSRTSFYLERRT
jgi:transposase